MPNLTNVHAVHFESIVNPNARVWSQKESKRVMKNNTVPSNVAEAVQAVQQQLNALLGATGQPALRTKGERKPYVPNLTPHANPAAASKVMGMLHQVIRAFEAAKKDQYKGTKGVNPIVQGLQAELKATGINPDLFWKDAQDKGLIDLHPVAGHTHHDQKTGKDRWVPGSFMVFVKGEMSQGNGKASTILTQLLKK